MPFLFFIGDQSWGQVDPSPLYLFTTFPVKLHHSQKKIQPESAPVALIPPKKVRVEYCIFSYNSTVDAPSRDISLSSTNTRSHRVLYYDDMMDFRDMVCPLSIKRRMKKVPMQIHSPVTPPVTLQTPWNGFSLIIPYFWYEFPNTALSKKSIVWKVESSIGIVGRRIPQDCSFKEYTNFNILQQHLSASVDARPPDFFNCPGLSHNSIFCSNTSTDLCYFILPVAFSWIRPTISPIIIIKYPHHEVVVCHHLKNGYQLVYEEFSRFLDVNNVEAYQPYRKIGA